MNDEQLNNQVHNAEKHNASQTIVALLILVSCWVLWFLLDGGWFTALALSVVGGLSGEYLGANLFTRKWLNNLSVETSGFSVLRIVLGVGIVLLIFGGFILIRLAVLRLFH